MEANWQCGEVIPSLESKRRRRRRRRRVSDNQPAAGKEKLSGS